MYINQSNRKNIEDQIIHLLPEFRYLAQNRLQPKQIQRLLKPNEVFYPIL